MSHWRALGPSDDDERPCGPAAASRKSVEGHPQRGSGGCCRPCARRAGALAAGAGCRVHRYQKALRVRGVRLPHPEGPGSDRAPGLRRDEGRDHDPPSTTSSITTIIATFPRASAMSRPQMPPSVARRRLGAAKEDQGRNHPPASLAQPAARRATSLRSSQTLQSVMASGAPNHLTTDRPAAAIPSAFETSFPI